jgi:ligand-binding sensor domain-containing protein
MINAIAIDRDDSKWIAGMYGIGRFDGSAWTVYTSTNPISMTGRTLTGISAIAVDNNGTKWFGTAWSILSFNGSTWTVYDCGASTFPCSGSTLTGIVVDNANVKWLGLSVPTGMPGSELVSFDGTTWRTYNTSNSGLPNNSVSTIAVDKDGAKWIGTYGGVARFDGTTWTVYNASNSALPGDQITAIAIDKDGIKWISANTMSNPRVVRFDGASWTIYDSLGWVNHIAVDVDNSKWFVTSSGMGLARYDGTTWTNYNSSNSPGMPSWINRITIDASGNKWTGANAPSGGIAVMWGGANYPITDNAQWTTNRTWRGTYDITSLIDRGTYTITVGSALGTDGMLIAPDSRFGFRVDYAGTITDKTPPNPPVVFATRSAPRRAQRTSSTGRARAARPRQRPDLDW